MKIKISYQKTLLIVVIFLTSQLLYAQTGTWTPLKNLAPNGNMGVMVVMTDGTIMCHNETGGNDGTEWDKLTPDINGSYVNGTWATMAAMHYGRLFFQSQVMPSGKLFAAGGEYGNGDTSGEVYDPVANSWTLVHGIGSSYNLVDGNSEILPDGRIYMCAISGPSSLYYTPSTNECTKAPTGTGEDEAAFVKLPDSSILMVGIGTLNSWRFRPQTDTWIADATLPDSLYDKYGGESGSAVLLPNGKAIFFGATGHNCIYTPTGTTAKGSWVRVADFPFIHGVETGMVDAPSAMMVNGHILCAVSPIGTSGSTEYNSPTYFVEYNYLTNTFAQVTSHITGTSDTTSYACYLSIMVDLPSGQVLYSIAEVGNTQYYIYTPGSAAIAQGKPTINSILPDGCPYYRLTGKLFNGISEGAQYGDDWQMASNYPIIRLSNAAGNVYYCKTTNWNRIGAVQTDSLEDTTVFEIPATLPAGTYSLVMVANGFASNPTLFTTLQASLGSQQNVACYGGTGTATASVTGGFTPYTYSWSKIGGSGNTGTGLTAGTYTVTVTDNNGCTATAIVAITAPKTAISITRDSVATYNSPCTGTAGVTLSGGTSPYTYIWNPGGETTESITGQCPGNYCCTITDNIGCSKTVCINIPKNISTGVDNTSSSVSSVVIYPNPFGDKAQLVLNGVNNGQFVVVTIYDVTGREIKQINSNGPQIEISRDGMSSGIYFYMVISAQDILGRGKFIVTDN